MNPVARRIDQHGRRTVRDITGRHLTVTWLQAVFEATALTLRNLAMDGEDRTDRDTGLDIRGAIERVMK